MTGPRISYEDYRNLGVEPNDKPSETRRIPRSFVKRLGRMPKLEQICFLAQNQHAIAHLMTDRLHFMTRDTKDLITPSTEWEKDGSRGILIRNYSSPSTTSDFFHLRSLTRASMDEGSGFPYTTVRRQWQEFAWYKDRKVPIDVVVKVYEANSDNWKWLETGRNRTMRKEAWDLLNAWYELPDEIESDSEEDEEDDADLSMSDDDGQMEEGEDSDTRSWITEDADET